MGTGTPHNISTTKQNQQCNHYPCHHNMFFVTICLCFIYICVSSQFVFHHRFLVCSQFVCHHNLFFVTICVSSPFVFHHNLCFITICVLLLFVVAASTFSHMYFLDATALSCNAKLSGWLAVWLAGWLTLFRQLVTDKRLKRESR